jgi:hypothetical protein
MSIRQSRRSSRRDTYRVRRTTVAIAAIAAAGLVPALGSTAMAAGHGGQGHAAHGQSGASGSGGSHGHAVAGGGAQTRQLHHQISVLDKRLVRLEGSRAFKALDDATEQAVSANIDNDRAVLATLDASVDAMSRADAQAARRQLRGFHVDNYVRVVAVLRHAEAIAAGAATVPAAQTALQQAIDAALGVTATSPRSATRDAQAALDDADQDIDDDTDGTDGTDDSTDGTDDSGDDSSTDGTGVSDGSGDQPAA